MKSLIWGIYGQVDDIDYSKNIQLFSANGKRDILRYEAGKLVVCVYKGSTGFRIIDNDHYLIILSGECFFTLPEPDGESMDTDRVVSQLLQQSEGLFTLCVYNKKKEQFILATDFFGLYPLFYYKNENYVMFSNEYQPLVIQNGKRLPLSKQAISSYFEYGFTLPGTTFFDQIVPFKERQLLQFDRKEWSVKTYGVPIQKTQQSFHQCVDALYQAMKKAVEKLFSNIDHPVVTLTGGLDTRMILALTNPQIRANGDYITFCLPPLNETNDKDVLIAQKIAQQFQLQHRIVPFGEKTNDLHSSYFEEIRNDEERPKLTGQYGGELLSGILYREVLPKNTNERLHALIHPTFPAFFIKKWKDKTLQKSIRNQEKKMVYLHLLASSFFSSIYGGTEGAWMHPWMNAFRYFSPFTDTEFLKVWHSIPDEYLFDSERSVYFELYEKYFREFKDIPTNSMLPHLSENGFHYFDEGLEPKKEKRNKSASLMDNIEQFGGYQQISEKYKNKKYLADSNQKQRFIDFCVWYDYYLQL